MNFEIVLSKSSLPTLLYNGKNILSSYNPLLEAKKIVEIEKEKFKDKKNIVIISDVLGYLKKAFKEISNANIYSIYFDKTLFENRVEKDNLDLFYTDINYLNFDYTSIYFFNYEAIDFICKEEKKVVWKNFLNNMSELKCNLSTELFFSKRWLKNTIRNCKSLNYFKVNKISNSDAIIVAPGFSLLNKVENLKKYNNYALIFAVSSSLFFLLKNKIIPDYVVITDASFYSLQLLNFCNLNNIKVLQPITSIKASDNSIFFSQQTNLENFFLKDINIEKFDEAPTVVATAYNIAKRFTTGKIYNCGADFKTHDIQPYAIPHQFYNNKNSFTNKYNSLHSLCYKQVINKNKNDLEIFSNYFKDKEFLPLVEFNKSNNNKKILPELIINHFSFDYKLLNNVVITDYVDVEKYTFLKYIDLNFFIKNKNIDSSFKIYKQKILNFISLAGKIYEN